MEEKRRKSNEHIRENRRKMRIYIQCIHSKKRKPKIYPNAKNMHVWAIHDSCGSCHPAYRLADTPLEKNLTHTPRAKARGYALFRGLLKV